MTPEMQLQAFIDSVNGTVQKLSDGREKLELHKASINNQLKEMLENTVETAKEELAEAFDQGQSNIESLIPAGTEMREATTSLQERLQGFIDQYADVNTAIVLSDEARANIVDMLAKPEEITDKLEEFKDALSKICEEFKDTVLEQLDEFQAHIEVFQEQSERIQETVSKIESEVLEHLGRVEEYVTQANSLYESTVTADHDALVELAFDQLFDKIERELNKGMESVNDAIAKLNNSGGEVLTDVAAAITEINDILEDAIKITEPVKPVLEIASSIA